MYSIDIKKVNRIAVFIGLFLFLVAGSFAQVNEKMITAAAKGDLHGVQKYCEKGADVNARNKARWTALAYAAKYGHLNVVKYLVETQSAEVDKKINTGETAMQVALKRGHTDVAKYLLEKGSDVNMRDIVGMTALSWAAKDGNMDMVKFLVENGADVNAQNPAGRTPIEITLSPDVKEFLKENGGKTGKEIMLSEG
jgi:ankyrin repeat protein